MKLSVSLPEDDVRYLDDYARERGIDSRSAAMREAIKALRSSDLEVAYADAWQEWSEGEDAALWESTSADGLQ